MRMRLVLGAIFGFFILLMIVVWIVSERSHPVLLDEQGRPVKSGEHAHH